MLDAVTDRLIDEPGTAEVLGVSRRSVRRLAEQEILERVKVGSATRYRLSDIEAIIREGTRPVRRGWPAVKPMTQLEQECAESLAFALANYMVTELPSLWAEDPAAVVNITLPVACALVRAESKATRNKGHAKAYRRAVRKARALLRTEPDTAVPLPVLERTRAFDPQAWHAELRPGIGHELLAVS